MAKTDYTKTENLFNEGLLKMSVQELLALADRASGKDLDDVPSVQARAIIISIMKHDVEILNKVTDANLSMGITAEELKDLLDKVKDLKPEEWVELKSIRERLMVYKKELWDKIPHRTNEQIIELERKKHINKRFNTRDKWLPLH